MRRTLGGVLLLLLVLPALRAEDKPADKPGDKPKEPPKAKPAGPADEYKAIVKEYNEAQQAAFQEYQKAESQADKQKVLREKMPKPDKFAPRFLELAERNPKDPAAVDALVWIVSNSRGPGKTSPRGKALEILGRDYVTSDKIGPVCDSMVYDQGADSAAFLRQVLEKNPSRDMQGRACLDLAMQLSNRKKEKEAEALLERAEKEFADVKHPFFGTVGKKADNMLFEVRFLSVGKTAPEVSGEDQDGKKFKLSDYRGKVVLMDFWGNW